MPIVAGYFETLFDRQDLFALEELPCDFKNATIQLTRAQIVNTMAPSGRFHFTAKKSIPPREPLLSRCHFPARFHNTAIIFPPGFGRPGGKGTYRRVVKL